MKPPVTRKTLAILFGVCSTVIALDWFSKQWAEAQGLIVVRNTGISFGWFSQLGFTSQVEAVFWIPVVMLGLVGVLWLFWRDLPSRPWPYSFLAAGGAANLLDRVVTGAVRDWLYIPFTTSVMPTYNNLADWSIVIGMLWVFFQSIKYKRKE